LGSRYPQEIPEAGARVRKKRERNRARKSTVKFPLLIEDKKMGGGGGGEEKRNLLDNLQGIEAGDARI